MVLLYNIVLVLSDWLSAFDLRFNLLTAVPSSRIWRLGSTACSLNCKSSVNHHSASPDSVICTVVVSAKLTTCLEHNIFCMLAQNAFRFVATIHFRQFTKAQHAFRQAVSSTLLFLLCARTQQSTHTIMFVSAACHTMK